MKIKMLFPTFLLLFGFAFGANAAPLQINFTGSISTAGTFSDPTGLFAQGDALSGFWLVDPFTADDDPDPTRGQYVHAGTPAFQINIGSSVFQANSTTIQILDDHTLGLGTIDAYDVLGEGSRVSTVDGFTIKQMQVTLRDTQLPLDALSSDALPAGAPDPAAFDQFGQVQGQLIGDYNNEDFFLNFEIARVSAVPIPAAAWLFGTALAVFAGISRSRKPA